MLASAAVHRSYNNTLGPSHFRTSISPRRQAMVARADANFAAWAQNAAQLAAHGGLALGTAATKVCMGGAGGAVAGLSYALSLPVAGNFVEKRVKSGAEANGFLAMTIMAVSTPVGAVTGLLVPSNNLLQVARVEAEGTALVAGACVIGAVLGSAAYKGFKALDSQPRDSDAAKLAACVMLSAAVLGSGGAAAGLWHVISHCR